MHDFDKLVIWYFKLAWAGLKYMLQSTTGKIIFAFMILGLIAQFAEACKKFNDNRK